MITPAVVNGRGAPAVEIGKSSFVFLWGFSRRDAGIMEHWNTGMMISF